MKKTRKLRAIIFLSLTLLLPVSATAADHAENEVLVLFRDSNMTSATMSSAAKESSAAKASAIARNVGAASRGSYPELTAGSGRGIAVISSSEKTADELIAELKENPEVLGAAKNYKRKAQALTPDDSLWSSQWGTRRIKAPELWEAASTGSDDVYVAVLDTGVIYDHPDLAANISGLLPDGTYGYFFHDKVKRTQVVRSGTPSRDITITSTDEVDYASWGDISGHGTHVAGIIGAAGNNALGVAGVNWRVKILPVGVFTIMEDKKKPGTFTSEAYDSDVIAALDYIVMLKRIYGLNIRAANISLGGWSPRVDQNTDPYAQSIKLASDAGIIVCIAAGNESQDIDKPDSGRAGKLPYPACFRFENTITVGASNEKDGLGRASGSNFSSSGSWVDIMAPGDNIMSTTPRYSFADSDNCHRDGYDSWSGTSMATPMVAGAAALLCAAYPDIAAAEIKEMLMYGAEDVLREGYSKYGLLNVYNAYHGDGGGGDSEDSGSSGGCSAGLAAFALTALIPLAAWIRKRRK
ncbi:MAG: S8 family serine peptidase [Synergistaceae bacterium]|nr:S8 family serine peptidase [Synergistaceae bacterium]